MSTRLSEVEKKALELDRRSRASLAARLLHSLETGESAAIERAWVLEAERRLAELRAGEVRPSPARTVLRKARQAVAKPARLRGNRHARSHSIR